MSDRDTDRSTPVLTERFLKENGIDHRVTVDIPDPVSILFNELTSRAFNDDVTRGGLASTIYEPVIILGRDHLWASGQCRIDSFSKLECGEGMYIGKHVHIASFTHIGIGGGLLILEQGASCASGVKIVTGSNVPGPEHGCSAIDPNAVIKRSFVYVKRNATLFCGVIVLPGVTIGEGAVAAAGAVVNRDVPDGETWGGIPARPIRKIPRGESQQRSSEPYGMVCPKCKSMVRMEASALNYVMVLCPICNTPSKKENWIKQQRLAGVWDKDGKLIAGAGGLAYEIRDQSEVQQLIKAQAPTRIAWTGSDNLDRWVDAQGEMYCWDDDAKENK